MTALRKLIRRPTGAALVTIGLGLLFLGLYAL